MLPPQHTVQVEGIPGRTTSAENGCSCLLTKCQCQTQRLYALVPVLGFLLFWTTTHILSSTAWPKVSWTRLFSWLLIFGEEKKSPRYVLPYLQIKFWDLCRIKNCSINDYLGFPFQAGMRMVSIIDSSRESITVVQHAQMPTKPFWKLTHLRYLVIGMLEIITTAFRMEPCTMTEILGLTRYVWWQELLI